jgi:serine/threonine protein kinase
MVDYYKILNVKKDASITEIKHSYHILVRKYHPDLNGGKPNSKITQLTEAFSVLNDLEKRARYDKTGCADLIKLKGHKNIYTLGQLFLKGELSDLYIATDSDNTEVIIKIACEPKVNDLLNNEWSQLKKLQGSSDADDTKGMLRYFPQLIDHFTIESSGVRRVAIVFSYLKNWYTLEDVHGAFKLLRFEHAAWMFNRILEALIHTHKHGIIHGCLIPSHIMVYSTTQDIDPWNHGGKLIDWSYATEIGNRVKAISPEYKYFYPPEVLNKQPATTATDIYMAALSILYVLGGDPKTQICPKSVPSYFSSFLKGCLIANPTYRPTDALVLHQEFKEHMRKWYGPKKYFLFEMPKMA